MYERIEIMREVVIPSIHSKCQLIQIALISSIVIYFRFHESDGSAGEPMSLVHMAVSRNHVELASWLTQKGFTFKNSEADDLFRDIIMGVIQVQNKGSCKPVKQFKNHQIHSLRIGL